MEGGAELGTPVYRVGGRTALAVGQQRQQCVGSLDRALLGDEVPAVQCYRSEVARAFPPDARHVVASPEAAPTPQRQRGAGDPELRVCGIVAQVDRRPRPVVLTGRVDRCRVEAPPVLGDGVVGERIGGPAPLGERPAKVRVRIGADEPLGQVRWLDEEEVSPDVRRPLLVQAAVDRAGTRVGASPRARLWVSVQKQHGGSLSAPDHIDRDTGCVDPLSGAAGEHTSLIPRSRHMSTAATRNSHLLDGRCCHRVRDRCGE
jgi:hypothetical protein